MKHKLVKALPIHRNNQRVGVAVAVTPEGPYTRVAARIFEANDADAGKHWMLAEDSFIWSSRRYGK